MFLVFYSTLCMTRLSDLRCRWVDVMARKRTGHMPSYAEAKKMK